MPFVGSIIVIILISHVINKEISTSNKIRLQEVINLF